MSRGHTWLVARLKASAQPAILIAIAMLLQIFATWPVPLAPQCTMFSPMISRYGRARANSASPPP
jgi:hypothetical protein